MTGVLDAMSNNPQAALDYLAQVRKDTGAGAKIADQEPWVDTTRVDTPSQRAWDPDGLAAFTAAIAAGTSLRSTTPLTREEPTQAQRATELAGTAIHNLAKNADPTFYNNHAKPHVD